MAIIKTETPTLFSDKTFEAIEQIQYWRKDMSGYYCHLFLTFIRNSATLSNIWEPLSARIGLEFQTELPNEIEMYNIYLVFLSKQKIEKEIKYKVEQDKYCCRKLVEDELGEVEFTDAYIQTLVEDKIFSLNTISVEKNGRQSVTDINVKSIINRLDKNVLKALEGFQSGNQKIGPYYDKYKNLFKNGA